MRKWAGKESGNKEEKKTIEEKSSFLVKGIKDHVVKKCSD